MRYGDGDQITYAVRSISLEIPDHGFFGIMGPSGSGKSSLLYLLSSLKRPTEGDIIYDGQYMRAMKEPQLERLRRNRFGFVFQLPYLLPYMTALENVMLAGQGKYSAALKEAVCLLEELNIGRLAQRYPAHLSGGERQRLVVARAMMAHPSIIFADEPTAALDHTNGSAVINLLKSYKEKGVVLVVTHDPAMISEADSIFYLADGKLDHISSDGAYNSTI